MQKLTCFLAAPLMLTGSLLADDATALLKDVHAAYAALGAVELTETAVAVDPQENTVRVVLEVTIDERGHVHTQMGDLTIDFIDETLYMADRNQQDRYAIVDAIGESLHAALAREIPDFLATPMFTMFGSEDPDVWLNALAMGRIDDPVATLLGRSADDGTVVDQISITGEGGDFVLSIDSATHLMTSLDGEFDEDGGTVTVSFDFSANAAEGMAPLVFDPGSRVAVASFRRLFQKPGELGSPVRPGVVPPDFTLEQLGGGTVTLSELKGRTVVLNLWATWCSPATRGLEKIEELARWVEQKDLDARVLTINVWESGDDDAYRRTKAANWMKSKGWTLPVLMSHKTRDAPDSLTSLWKISGIPLTVVIDPQGEVTMVKSGVSNSVIAELKEALAAAAPIT